MYRLETCWLFVRPGFKTGFFQNFPPAIQGDNGGEGDRIGRHTRRAETDYGRTGHPSQGVSYLPSLPPPPSSVLPPLHPLLLPFLAFPLSPSVTTIYHQCFLPFSLLLSPHSVILATSLAFTVPSSPKTGINHHLLTDPSTMSGDDFVLIYKPFSDVIVIK